MGPSTTSKAAEEPPSGPTSKTADAVREAAAAAEAAPPELRAKAFEMVLAKLLAAPDGGGTGVSAEEGSHQKPARKIRRSNGPAGAAASPVEEEELARLTSAPAEFIEKYAFIGQLSDARLKLYAAIRFARDACGIDGLTEGQIRAVLQGKFRENMPRGTVGGKLSTAPMAELNRVPLGRKTKYQLMRAGEAKLAAAIDELSTLPKIK